MARLETPERSHRSNTTTNVLEPPGVERRTTGLAARIARVITGGLVMGTGAIHLHLYQSYFSAVPTIGRLFVANFVAALVLGGLVVLRRSPWLSGLGAVFCLATLGAFLVTVHWGLFGYRETLHGTWQTRAAAVEVAGGVAGLVAAALSWRTGRQTID